MRKFFSLILVVAMLAGVSCTTDVTEDLTIGIGGKTELTVSLEGSRIALGDKVGGEYQALWSEGDKISINGIASGEAAIDGANKALATFSFEGALATPYNIVYPAAAAGKVVFASEQSFVNGTFSAGATPMYGYTESASGVTLQHLAGVLKIGVTGSATLLGAQVSTIDRLPIAGLFDIDCATGEVTATESALEVIEYSFGDGLALSSEAQYIHIAVPAGVYNELYVTLYDSEGGVMYATVKANDEKPLNAGAVREFTNAISYAATDAVFVIRDVESLKSYAEALAATTAETPLTKDAILVADIDMSGVEDWVSPSGWGASLNGNGYAIKGMTKPLFDSVTMNIKGLHLTGVDIEETEKLIVGSLARYYSGNLSHCSAEGSLVVNNTTYAEASVGSYKDINIGGMVGRTVDSTVEYCENKVDITLQKLGATGYASAIGGVVGATACAVVGEDEDLTTASTFTNLTNRGSITYAASAHKGNMYISGVVGRIIGTTKSIARLRDCSNYGEVSTTAESVTSSDILVSGITGTVTFLDGEVAANLANYADLTLRGKSASSRIAGIFSYTTIGAIENCLNEGALSVSDNGDITAIYIAGIGTALSTSTIKNCRNKGALSVGDNVTVNGYVQLGGITNAIGGEGVLVEKCYNEAPISVGSLTNSKTGNSGRLVVGGIASNFSGVDMVNCENLAGGTINLKPNTIGSEGMIGGVIGYLSTASVADHTINVTDCANRANVNFAPVVSAQGLYLGGILGQHWANKADLNVNFTRVNNYGDVTGEGGTPTVATHIGGIVAYIFAEMDFDSCNNYGDISCKFGEALSTLYMGGFVGRNQHRCTDTAVTRISTFKNCSNEGKVLAAPKEVTGSSYIGGFLGSAYNVSYTVVGTEIDTYDDCVNKGDIEVSGSGTLNQLWASHFIGYLHGGATLTNCSSTADSDLTISIANITDLCMTGWNAHCQHAAAKDKMVFDKCSNYSNTTISSTGLKGDIRHHGLMGSNSQAGIKVSGSATYEATDCVASGKFNMTGKTTGALLYGGLCCYPYASGNVYTVKNFTHEAEVNFSGEVGTNAQISSFAQYISATMVVTNAKLGGSYNFSGTVGTYIAYGGFWSNINHGSDTDSYEGVHSADVTVTGTVGTNVVVGGFSAQHRAVFNIGDCTNTGNITLGTPEKALTINGTYVRVGGISCGGSTGYDGENYVHTHGKLVNTGNISIQNTTVNSECEVLVGGIYGFRTGPVDDATVKCNISVLGIGQAKVGMIMGSERNSVSLATNCKVGGMIANGIDDNGDPNWVVLKEDNYFDYIYGSGDATDWGESTNFDGCTFISEL